MENVVVIFVLLKDGVKGNQLEGNSAGIWGGTDGWRQGLEYVLGQG